MKRHPHGAGNSEHCVATNISQGCDGPSYPTAIGECFSRRVLQLSWDDDFLLMPRNSMAMALCWSACYPAAPAKQSRLIISFTMASRLMVAIAPILVKKCLIFFPVHRASHAMEIDTPDQSPSGSADRTTPATNYAAMAAELAKSAYRRPRRR
jgi:hypothetical protein